VNNPGVCAECAKSGPSCCQLSRIFLTEGDKCRILEWSGDDEFYEREAAGTRPVPPDMSIDPLWYKTFTHPRGRLVLRQIANGDCCFLRPDGCALPLEVRPLVCRLYPFEYNQDTIKGIHAHRCPRDVSDNAPLLLALLGMNRERGEEWRRLFYRELEEEYGGGA
jgi:Uncharacterised protein family (UPF0153).